MRKGIKKEINMAGIGGMYALALLINQLLRTRYFSAAGWTNVIGFPNWIVPIKWAFFSSFLIGLWAFLLVLFFGRLILEKNSFNQRWIMAFGIIFFPSELLMQIFGRSLIKGVFDFSIFIVFLARIQIEAEYNRENIKKHSLSALNLLHREISGLLRLFIQITFFIIGGGSLSTRYSAKLLKDFYSNPNSPPHGSMLQWAMWWFWTMVLTITLFLLFLVVVPLYKKLIEIRKEVIAKGFKNN